MVKWESFAYKWTQKLMDCVSDIIEKKAVCPTESLICAEKRLQRLFFVFAKLSWTFKSSLK